MRFLRWYGRLTKKAFTPRYYLELPKELKRELFDDWLLVWHRLMWCAVTVFLLSAIATLVTTLF